MVRQNNDTHLFLFLLLLLLSLLLWTSRGIRQKYRPRPAKTLPISRRQIENIVYRKLLFQHILVFILILLFMLLLHLIGRMGLGAAIASTLVVWIVPAWSLYVIMYLQWRPLRSVPDEFWARLEKEMSLEILQRLDGAWQFCNWSWYIRASNQECILLRAEIIDFQKPIRQRSITMHSIGLKNSSIHIYSHECLFTGKDGSIIRARTEQTPHITSWVKSHRGRFE